MHPGAINHTEPGLGEGICSRAARHGGITIPSLWQARLAAAAAVGGIKVCGMVAISAEGAVALLRSGSC